MPRHRERLGPAPLDDRPLAEREANRARRRAEAGRDEPAVLPRHLLLTHHAADRAPRPPARSDALDRIGDDELVQRPFDLLRGKPRGEVARDVVEPERGQHDRLGLNLRVDESDPLLLAARVEVVRPRVDGRLHRPETELEKRPGERRDDLDPCERGAQRLVVARVGDAHLLARRLASASSASRATADEPHLEPCPPGLVEHEAACEPRDAEDRERHEVSVG